MNLVGIDIGNSCCVVALAKHRGFQVLLNNDGKYETPSMVSFADNRRKFGSEAVSSAMMNLTSTISQLKRLIGKQFHWVNQEELKDLPFKTTEGEDGGILIHIRHCETDYTFKPIHILAMILSHLLQMIQRNDQHPISHCVIGVPSYFTDRERIAYRDAAKVVELKNLQLMNEGTAIALGYGFYKTTDIIEPYHVVFVDIGHSDTQVTVVLYDGEDMQVLAHASDRNLGGRDFDKVLFSHFAEEFKDSFKLNISDNARGCARLMEACEKVKRVLTSSNDANVSVESLMENKDLIGSITRNRFAELSAPLLERIWTTCYQALNNARLSTYQHYSVELVGSGSRIPAISSILEQRFGKPMNQTLNASECVARGCALQALSLSPNSRVKIHKVRDSIPFDVWFRNKTNEQIDFLFYKGAKFPNMTAFGFPHINQTLDIDINIPMNNQCISTRSYKVGNFSTSTSEFPILLVNIGIDADGIISLKSATLSTIQQQRTPEQVLTPTDVTDLSHLGVTQTDLAQIKALETTLINQDKSVEDSLQRKNELEGYILETKKKLTRGVYQDLVTVCEKEEYLNKLEEMQNWLENHDEKTNIYTAKHEELKQIFSPVDLRQKSIVECTDSTRELEDFINKQIEAANSMANVNLREAVCNEIREADEWLKACVRLQNTLPKDICRNELACKIRERKNALQESCQLIQTDYNYWFTTKRNYGSRETHNPLQKDQDDTSQQDNVQWENKGFLGSFANAMKSLVPWRSFRNNKDGDSRQSSKSVSNNRVASVEPQSRMNGEGNYFQDRGSAQTTGTPATVEEIHNSASVQENFNNKTCESKENDKNSAENVEGSENDSEANLQTKTRLEKCIQSTNETVRRYRSFATVSEIDKIGETLRETEKWFYDEASSKFQKACIEKMIELEDLLKPIEDRISVDQKRSPAICELLYFIFDCRVSVISSHESQKNVINEECEIVEQWLVCKMKDQNSLPKNADPVLHPDEIQQRMDHLNKRIVEISLRYYMSEIQHKLHSGRYDSFVSDGEVGMIFYKVGLVSKVLNDNRNYKSEDFLYSSLIELKQCFGPIENRFRDAEDSRVAFDKLSNRISHYRDSASKLSDGQISAMIINKCNEVQKWIWDVDPFPRSSEVNKVVEDMEMICEDLLKLVKQRANTTNRSNCRGNQHNQTQYENREFKVNQNQYSHDQMGGNSIPREAITLPFVYMNIVDRFPLDQRAMGMQSNDRCQPSSNLSSHTINNSNPIVYFLIGIGQARVGRLVIRLFMDVVPKTAKNFLSLCTGEKKYVSYAGTLIHSVVPGQLCQGGVYKETQEIIYGTPSFPQEKFFKKHTRRGILSMTTEMRAPKMSHATGFNIFFQEAPSLDNRCVVFGEIIDGMDVLDQIEAVGGTNGITKKKVVIVDCDQLN